MNFQRIVKPRVLVQTVRRMSNEVVKAAETPKPVAAPAAKPAAPAPAGSTFFQRFSSFLTGCGVGFGLSFYFIYNELEESNAKFERELQAILAKVEKK
jgi:hypothetical protein|eukprot:gene11342-8065_t